MGKLTGLHPIEPPALDALEMVWDQERVIPSRKFDRENQSLKLGGWKGDDGFHGIEGIVGSHVGIADQKVKGAKESPFDL